jgi:hypothetical protein
MGVKTKKLRCPQCRKWFTPWANGQKRCSIRCTRVAAKERETIKRRAGLRLYEGRHAIPDEMICEVCSTRFRPWGYKSRYCSPLCRNRARDKRRARRYRIRRREIFQRDEWMCQICKKPVSQRIKTYPHPLAPTVDHIIPVILGGTDDAANLQTAHMRCNSSKGARW